MKNASHFQRGSGVYTCRVCGHRTRATGRGDNENVELCADCFDLAGLENQVSDGEPLSAAQQVEVNHVAPIINRRAGREVWNPADFGLESWG